MNRIGCASIEKEKRIKISTPPNLLKISRLLIMPLQYREISHKNVSTRCNILSFRRRESGMLISRFLGRSCEKRRGRFAPPPLPLRIESTSGPVNDIIRRRDENSTRTGPRCTHGVYTCANVYRFKKRSHHPLFLFHPDRGIDIPDHPDLFLDVGPRFGTAFIVFRSDSDRG